jgi:ankyrin repeat protein
MNERSVVQAGINPSARNTFGKTALSYAEEEESQPIVKLLKAAGARF